MGFVSAINLPRQCKKKSGLFKHDAVRDHAFSEGTY